MQLHIRSEGLQGQTADVRLQGGRDAELLQFFLVEMLKQTGHGPLDRDKSAVEHVRVSDGLPLPVLGLQQSSLVVCAVGDRDQLPESLLPGVPGLKIDLPHGGIVELAGDDVHQSVGNQQRLVEPLSILDHLEHVHLALLRVAGQKLLYFLKLMQSEQPMDISAVGAGLPSETAGVACHQLRQLFGLEGLTFVVSGHGLLTGGDEAEIVLWEAVEVSLDGLKLAAVLEH